MKITSLQNQRNESRYEAHLHKDTSAWDRFRKYRNELKIAIRQAKMTFYRNIFNTGNSKEIWKVINNVLHPPPKRISIAPYKLNSYFTETAARTVNAVPKPVIDIEHFIKSLPDTNEIGFKLEVVS